MATNLDTPIPKADATQQGIVHFEIYVPHRRNAGNTAMEIDKPKIHVRYDVATWDADGNRVAVASRNVIFGSWPAAFVTNVKDVYQKLEQDAKANGLIGAGTDEPLE